MTLPSSSTLAADASAQDAASLVHFEPLSALWLDTLLPIEEQAYVHPWTRGNFQDAMVAGYQIQLLVDADHQLLGYFVAMQALDEVHLLNITVNPACQRQGWARVLLDALALWSAAECPMDLAGSARKQCPRPRGLPQARLCRSRPAQELLSQPQRPARTCGAHESETMALNLDARQRAMLEAMGITVWLPEPVEPAAVAAVAAVAAAPSPVAESVAAPAMRARRPPP
jgi:GNAT superfamily N-acetyltransferase